MGEFLVEMVVISIIEEVLSSTLKLALMDEKTTILILYALRIMWYVLSHPERQY
jgi:hypothetical protein